MDPTSIPSIPLDRRGRPLAGAVLAAHLRAVARAALPVELVAEVGLQVTFGRRNRGDYNTEAPPWRR